ncbi:hypothetical protein K435DRAFT_465770 [Dendrothele bispora CBS 962.96]|uniref:Uncharacterized protein n=1 Tax=Dendrothele bispora (strain CBS 962.96) TaxID=1314807 RepID=A0A4S8L0G2_DENBC|nr:hypothetical protein K435DRAFT_465770 [Dendrothele bispora CBS 962.96]
MRSRNLTNPSSKSPSITTFKNQRWTTDPRRIQSRNLNCLSESRRSLSHQDYHLPSIQSNTTFPVPRPIHELFVFGLV